MSSATLFFVDTSNDTDRIKANVTERNRHEEILGIICFGFVFFGV